MRAPFSDSSVRIVFWLCALLVLILALLPPKVPMPTTGWDKSNHVLAFGTLAVLGLRGWRERTWLVLAGLLVYGVLIEYLQGLTPYRDADAIDVVADAVGMLLGLACHVGLRRGLR